MWTVRVDVRGPLFDGRARAEVDKYLAAAVWEVAKQARGDLGVQFIRVFKHPTGFYESRTEAVRLGPYAAKVHDNGVVYGPWLEGIGSRNYPVTRFKGYHSYKLVTAALERKADDIAERVLPPYLAAMNGGV